MSLSHTEAHSRRNRNLARSIDRLLLGTLFTQKYVDDLTRSLAPHKSPEGSESRVLRDCGDTVATHKWRNDGRRR